jgi:hypothetical protein
MLIYFKYNLVSYEAVNRNKVFNGQLSLFFYFHSLHVSAPTGHLQVILNVDYRLCIIWIIHQELWGYEVEEKLHLGLHEREMLKLFERSNAGILDRNVTPGMSVCMLLFCVLSCV